MSAISTTILEGLSGLKIRSGDGAQDFPFYEMMSTPLFYLAQPGDRLCLLDNAYAYAVATYAPEIDPRWLYTYDYAPDQSWTVYRHDLTGGSYRQDAYTFTEHVYFRVCLRKVDGGLFNGSEDMGAILRWEAAGINAATSADTSATSTAMADTSATGTAMADTPVIAASSTPREKAWIAAEAARVTRRVESLRRPGDKVFALLTDSHYTVNGTWDDTVAAIYAMHRQVCFDGIIHLGDFTDGMVTAAVTRLYVKRVLHDLKACGVPVWAAIGNHDSNYFRKNPDRFSLLEQSRLYLGTDEPRYVVDVNDEGLLGQGLRFVFLDSFDPGEALRYGYSSDCAAWLKRQLAETPKGWRVMVFSHLPPETRLQYWAKTIRGEQDIRRVLNAHADKIVAFINGHNHADLLDNAGLFPVVGIGNAKCEAFFDYKPAGSVTPERRLGEASQELWDIMLVNTDGTDKQSVRFVRFGAGRDRIIDNERARWL